MVEEKKRGTSDRNVSTDENTFTESTEILAGKRNSGPNDRNFGPRCAQSDRLQWPTGKNSNRGPVAMDEKWHRSVFQASDCKLAAVVAMQQLCFAAENQCARRVQRGKHGAVPGRTPALNRQLLLALSLFCKQKFNFHKS